MKIVQNVLNTMNAKKGDAKILLKDKFKIEVKIEGPNINNSHKKIKKLLKKILKKK